MGFLSQNEKQDLLRNITLEDDRFFSKCLSGSNECAALMLRIILSRDDLEVVETRTQEWMQNIVNHSIRLDIYAKDKKGNIYDIEIQKTASGASRRRARYYSAMLDTESLKKGEDYEKLPESYIIFLTSDDVIGEGKALYMIERRVEETGSRFMDGTHIVYVSSSLADKDTALGYLVHDLKCADPERMYYTELSERVRFFKEKEEGMIEMGKEYDEVFEKIVDRLVSEAKADIIQKGMKEGIQKGKREGIKEGRLGVARTMIADGSVPLSKIAEFSGLSLNEVENIRAHMFN